MSKIGEGPKRATSADGSPRRVEPSGKSQRRRQELIDAAAKIFQDKGYEAASIQDIADALNILKGSVYYYIDTKEDLLFAAIDQVHRSALANMDKLRQLDDPPLTLIRLFIESHIKHISDNLVKATVFFHDFRSLDRERHDYIVAERDEYDAFLRGLIARGQADGSICPDIDPKLATLAILGMMNWSYQWYRVGGGLDPMEIGRQFADIALGGLACDPETHKAGHSGEIGKIPPNISISRGGTPIVVDVDAGTAAAARPRASRKRAAAK